MEFRTVINPIGVTSVSIGGLLLSFLVIHHDHADTADGTYATQKWKKEFVFFFSTTKRYVDLILISFAAALPLLFHFF